LIQIIYRCDIRQETLSEKPDGRGMKNTIYSVKGIIGVRQKFSRAYQYVIHSAKFNIENF
jgi:hypothetical protein